VRAGTLNVALIDNTNEGGSQFAFAFQTFWVPYINNMGGFTIAGDPNSPYTLDVVKYSFNTNTANMSVMNSVFGKIAASQDMNGNPITDRDVVVVGASQGNANVIATAEAVGLPNFHCSGGNPFFLDASEHTVLRHSSAVHLVFPESHFAGRLERLEDRGHHQVHSG